MAGRDVSPELDRQLPYDLDAEMGVLGSVLLMPEACDEIALEVRADDFFDDGGVDYAVTNVSSIEVDARYNWWGPTAAGEMDAGGNPKDISRINDFYDTATWGYVNYGNWMECPSTLGNIASYCGETASECTEFVCQSGTWRGLGICAEYGSTSMRMAVSNVPSG